jgi:hypothetical protein
MAFRNLSHNYHDGQLSSFAIGPRNEVTLDIHLDAVWNRVGPSSGRIRFGAIENMEEVKTFFEGIPSPGADSAFLAEVIGIIYEHKAKWILDLAEIGSVVIKAKHCDEV